MDIKRLVCGTDRRVTGRGALWLALALVLEFAFANNSTAADLSVARAFFAQEQAIEIESPSGAPPAAAIRARDGQIVAYAFSTRDVSGSVGYSGRPIDIVAAVSPSGTIAGATIVAHEEPILVIGVPREALAAYVSDFKGFDVRAGGALKAAGARADRGPHAVAGASVTSAVIRDAIVRSARAVLSARATASPGGVRLNRETRRLASWPALVNEGSLRRLLVTRGEASQRLGTGDSEPGKTFIELWLALATPPAIGESLLGQRLYESETAAAGPDDNLLIVAANGLYSFKGTDWRRTGVFERIELIQGDKTIRFRSQDQVRVDTLHAAGTPELREVALFRIAQSTGFDPTAPFRLDLALSAETPNVPRRPPPVVSLQYRLPEKLLVPAAAPNDSSANKPGGPVALEPMSARPPLWQEIWWARRLEIALLVAMLGGLAGILIFQDTVTSHGPFYYRLRTGYLILTFAFLGLTANAQLSVVNVLTFIHALLSGFRWELFLLDPMAFLLWSFVAASLLFWGRGVFCGWLCPFGALQELLNLLAQRLGVKQIQVPFGLHERLWMIKYVVFLGILAVSLNSIVAAFTLAEIEPFKTSITMKFMREWPFVVYAVVLLVCGLFIERFFCRYLCPLGAALAIPARIRMFEWLKRYRECGAECRICAYRCTVQAIHPLGQINPNECVYCLKCQANYFDESVCIHLKKRAERRRPPAVKTETKGPANVA